MNNSAKMRLRKHPVIYRLFEMTNRTLGNLVRAVVSFPSNRRQNNELLDRIKNAREVSSPHVWYFCVPTHSNLGDQARRLVIERWLARSYPDHFVVRVPSASIRGNVSRALRAMRPLVGPDDLMIMQSGHTMGAFHPDDLVHRVISRAFPETRIVFFPNEHPFCE